MKRVSFKVAKALKEAGYKFTPAPNSFFTNETNSWFDESDGELYSLPFAMEVWLWLWRENKIMIDINTILDSTEGFRSLATFKCQKGMCNIEASNPEEAIEKAIEYLVSNNLIK